MVSVASTREVQAGSVVAPVPSVLIRSKSSLRSTRDEWPTILWSGAWSIWPGSSGAFFSPHCARVCFSSSRRRSISEFLRSRSCSRASSRERCGCSSLCTAAAMVGDGPTGGRRRTANGGQRARGEGGGEGGAGATDVRAKGPSQCMFLRASGLYRGWAANVFRPQQAAGTGARNWVCSTMDTELSDVVESGQLGGACAGWVAPRDDDAAAWGARAQRPTPGPFDRCTPRPAVPTTNRQMDRQDRQITTAFADDKTSPSTQYGHFVLTQPSIHACRATSILSLAVPCSPASATPCRPASKTASSTSTSHPRHSRSEGSFALHAATPTPPSRSHSLNPAPAPSMLPCHRL